MPLQELINQYEQIWTGGGGGGASVSGSKHWTVITFNRACPIFFAGDFQPVPPPPVIGPGDFGSLALPGWTTLGPVTFSSGGVVSLADMFTTRAIRGATSASIIFCTHELNNASDLIFIGDGTMTSASNAATSLKGPNVVYKIEHKCGYNSLGLGNITLTSNSLTAQCRVSVITS